jgi:hypothetical protein
VKLVIVQGPGQGQSFDLVEGELVAGREPEREIYLPSRRVSRKHCTFSVTGDRCIVRDLGSANGLLVNGHRMEACELVDGTQVQIGDVVVVFQAAAQAPTAPTPEPERGDYRGQADPASFGGHVDAPAFGDPAPFGPPAGDPAPFGAPAGDPAPFGGEPPAGFGAPPEAAPFTPAEPARPAQSFAQGPTTPPGATPAPTAPSALGKLPWTVRLAGLLVLSSLIVLCGPFGGIISLVMGGGDKVEEMSIERGWALTEGLGLRNAVALSQRQHLLADADIFDDPFVKVTMVSDTSGKVVAPPEKINRNLRTGAKTAGIWDLAEREGRGVYQGTEEGYVAFLVPVKGSLSGSETKNLKVGYAYLVYDSTGAANDVGKPTWRLAFAFLWLVVAGGVTLVGVRRLATAPLVTVREETELAMKGDAPQVETPSNWPELADLVHSINRAIARR